MSDQNLPYDLKSVMQYGNKAFTKNETLNTVISIKYPDLLLGNTKGLSQGDVDEIKKLYHCDGKCLFSYFADFAPRHICSIMKMASILSLRW